MSTSMLQSPAEKAQKPIRVLLIEDNVSFASVLKKRLELDRQNAGFQIHHSLNLKDGIQFLTADPKTDVVVLDLGLPDSQGLFGLNEIHYRSPETPVLVLTGREDEELGIQSLQEGAQDYLVKGRFDAREIPRALKYAITRNRMQMELIQLSLVDELTGLRNRRGFFILAEQAIKLSFRKKETLLFVFLDLDGLKQINDTRGHSVGDQMIVDFSKLMRATFRQSDILARIGGDEFAVLALGAGHYTKNVILSHLYENVEACNQKSGSPFTISVSAGVEIYDPEYPLSLEELVANADKDMYRLKKEKKNEGHSHETQEA